MKVVLYETTSLESQCYDYNKHLDILQVAQDVINELNTSRNIKIDSYAAFEEALDDLSKGLTTDVAISKLNDYLGTIGTEDDIAVIASRAKYWSI